MLNNTQYLKYFLNILFSLLLCLSFFSNRVNGVSSRKGTFYSSLLHHNIYYISEWPKKSKEGKNSQKYTSSSGTAWKKIKLDHQHHTNFIPTLSSKRYTIGYKEWGWEERVAFLETSFCSSEFQSKKSKPENVEVFLWSAFEPRLLVSNLTLS